MIAMMISAAVAAAAPQAAPAMPQQHADHGQQMPMQHMQAGDKGEHKPMDCCPCCKDMAKHQPGDAPKGDHSSH